MHHYFEAGDLSLARAYAPKAAENAAKALAFERAASLYARAVSLSAGSTDIAFLQIKQAEALAKSGRCYDAAQLYLKIAEGLAGLERWELRRLAAEQLLAGAYTNEGLAIIQSASGVLDISLPRNGLTTLLGILLMSAMLLIRGIAPSRRSAASVSSTDIVRLDMLWSVTKGTTLSTGLLGLYCQTRHLLLALKVGEPVRMVRGLVSEGYLAANRGTRALFAAGIIAQVNTMSGGLQSPSNRAMALSLEGVVAVSRGDWLAAEALLGESERVLLKQCSGQSWEISYQFHLIAIEKRIRIG